MKSIGFRGAGITVDSTVAQLSGGERQGIAIGRAMHYNADLIVLDEPTAALGGEGGAQGPRLRARASRSPAAPASISSTISRMCTRSPTGWSCSTAARSSREIRPKDMSVAELTEYLIDLQHKTLSGHGGPQRTTRLIQRIEGLPIILVFVLLLALLHVHGAAGLPARRSSTRRSSRRCRR